MGLHHPRARPAAAPCAGPGPAPPPSQAPPRRHCTGRAAPPPAPNRRIHRRRTIERAGRQADASQPKACSTVGNGAGALLCADRALRADGHQSPPRPIGFDRRAFRLPWFPGDTAPSRRGAVARKRDLDSSFARTNQVVHRSENPPACGSKPLVWEGWLTGVGGGPSLDGQEALEGMTMKWKTPVIVEIAVGLEINAYACAEVE